MRILVILIVGLFLGGAIMLSIYAEKSINESRLYGNDELVKDIKKYVEENEHGSISQQPQIVETKQVINFDGTVDNIQTSPGSTTYFDEPPPATNEGMPGQPLPMTGQPPMIPVYK